MGIDDTVLLNLSQTQSFPSSKANEESSNIVKKPLQVSASVGPSQTHEPGSSIDESYNRSNSDYELQKVAASLNHLLSDLKNDSETTLYPALDRESKDRKIESRYNDEKSIYYSSDENEQDLELIFDPLGNSFTDSRTGNRYILDD